MSDPQHPPGHSAAPPPPGTPGAPAAGRPDQAEETEPQAGLLATAVGVVVTPGATLRQVTAWPRLTWALVVAVVVGALTSIGNAADAALQAGPMGEMAEGLAVATAITAPLLQLAMLALGALVVLGAARLLGGRGGYLATFTGMAFALVPWALTAALPLLGALAGFPGRVVDGVLTVVVAVWVIALTVLAVQSAHHLSTGRALAATLAPVVAAGAALGLLIAFLIAIVAAIGVAAFA